jgi:hypothetical protein
MLNPVTFTITDDAGVRSEITAAHPDYVAYEAKFDKPIIESMQRGMVSCYMFLAWSAMKRQGATQLAFDSWLENPPEVDIEAKATEPAPLDPTPPRGPSPASLSRRA